MDRNFAPNSNDFVLLLSDWYPEDAEKIFWTDAGILSKFAYGLNEKSECHAMPRDAIGLRVDGLPWISALINGRGWENETELEEFAAK